MSSKYWSNYPKKKKLTKKEIKLAHKQAKKLKKYEDRVEEPYGLATYQVKKGYKIKK